MLRHFTGVDAFVPPPVRASQLESQRILGIGMKPTPLVLQLLRECGPHRADHTGQTHKVTTGDASPEPLPAASRMSSRHHTAGPCVPLAVSRGPAGFGISIPDAGCSHQFGHLLHLGDRDHASYLHAGAAHDERGPENEKSPPEAVAPPWGSSGHLSENMDKFFGYRPLSNHIRTVLALLRLHPLHLLPGDLATGSLLRPPDSPEKPQDATLAHGLDRTCGGAANSRRSAGPRS